ncbi:phosphate ABC transporter substrate-binding protein, PhoT family [Paludibacter propionicigenes WB4]|uniref:Phosphate ABC transporter substrate-binding protein, PhoT family n=1 Tax=Paludibacter propionicigenes (strain DSM 17365 / JCM 13257 / WB4) TaxID=694427 RepID=E4T4W5_PALPW|nr:PstS family phosphate ABC transporter substrate-binding protein [Paludibacter propionicigenes]ADQ79759.1 phosphate ABC transporter substrate-binding protein, PhoT family [Paludibacter propionicigenes WB4]
MKKIVTLTLVFAVILGLTNQVQAQKNELKGQISLSGAFALYPLAVKWAEEFKKLHPNVKIDVSGGGAGKGITDALAKVVDLGMVSREVKPEEVAQGAWFVAVAKDAVVPTINAKNPKIKELLAKGLTQAAATKIFITEEYKTWGQVLGVQSNIPLHLYVRSDACGAGETWAKYLGNKKQEDLKGTAVFGDPGVASAVQKDPLGLGYNNIAYAYDLKTKKPNSGILVLPIDVNNNGKIDAAENFYATSNQLISAIAQGKYPSPPARDLYLVANGKPTNPAVVAFLKFILTEGQKYNVPNGYISLPKEKLNKGIAKLK